MKSLSTIITLVKWTSGFVLLAIVLYTLAAALDPATDARRLLLAGLLCCGAFLATLLPSRTRRLDPVLLIPLMALFVWEIPGGIFAVGVFAVCYAMFRLIVWLLREKTASAVGNVVMMLVSIGISLLIIEILSPTLTDLIINAQRQTALNAAIQAANAPLDASEITGRTVQQVRGLTPQVDYLQTSEGPEWAYYTAWGSNTDTVMRYWMDGIYDNTIVYNHQGMRGEAIAYEKPDDVYRIMFIGDSFIEAREVADDETIIAQLRQLLADVKTSDGKQFEIFGLGATGWGTIQAYLYYHHEGYKFQPDLIITPFIINDVVDNNPRQFYPDRQIDFAINDTGASVVRDGVAETSAEAFNPALNWLSHLPFGLSQRNTANLLRQVVAPPRQPVTVGGDLTRLHPQTYVFVRYPELEGYEEGWQRTRQAYTLWANEAAANGSQLMVVAVDIGTERITELSTYWRDQQADWIWDMDLPYDRLLEILDPLDVIYLNTRSAYEDYARPTGIRPYDVLFYAEDGHWNPTGHRVTAELIAQTLRELRIIPS